MNVAENINITLKEKDLQQKELAHYLGIAPSTLNGWLKLGRSIPSKYLIRISEFLEVSIEYLLGVSDPSSKNNISNNNNNGNNIINDHNYSKEPDGISKEMLNKFEELDFNDKVKVMSLIAELSEKKGA